MSHSELYFDYNSTTPPADGVREAVSLYLEERFGNPSNAHNLLGRQAKVGLDVAREQVSKFMGASPDEVIFTSGGTESIFLAIVGSFRAAPEKRHVIISEVEHPAVNEAVRFLEEMFAVQVTRLPVSIDGAISLAEIEGAIRDDTALVSVMAANNETGVLSPVKEIAALAKQKGVLFHTDAVQAAGKMPFRFSECGADLVSVSGHKIGAAKGVGALLIRQDTPWLPVMKGGGQENGRRGGTESVPLVVGFGAAAQVRRVQLEHGMQERVGLVRDHFEKRMLDIPGTKINGARVARLSNTSNVQISNIIASDLLAILSDKGVALSTGSACKSSSLEPSHVLRAMGLSIVQCLSSIRVSFGPENSLADADRLFEMLSEAILPLRKTVTQELRTLQR